MANIRVARRSGRIFRGGSFRRDTQWGSLASTVTTLASGTPVLFGGLSAVGLALRPFTIIRVRGYLNIASDQLAAAEHYAASFGMCVVTEQALAIGVTAVPTPQTDKSSDLWFVYEELAGAVKFIAGAALSEQSPGFSFDSRAMRKVEEGQDIAVVEESVTGFVGCELYKGGRFLLKLH